MSGQQSAPSLAYTKAHSAEMSNNGKVALVAEGGGQRGIFTAGVLDTWLDAGHDPFDILIGTSAGSQKLNEFCGASKRLCKASYSRLNSTQTLFPNGKRFNGQTYCRFRLVL